MALGRDFEGKIVNILKSNEKEKEDQEMQFQRKLMEKE